MIVMLEDKEAKRQRIREAEIAKHTRPFTSNSPSGVSMNTEPLISINRLIFASLFLASLLLLFTFQAEGKEKKEALYHVTRVIDGDTVKIEGGQLVRYIGIDTPEIRERRNNGRWKYDPEPYAEEAKTFNETLVKGQEVKLEFDVQETDRFGRLLAYVYVGDIFVNREILRQGYAQLLTIPPNVRYVGQFRDDLIEARRHTRGLWKRK